MGYDYYLMEKEAHRENVECVLMDLNYVFLLNKLLINHDQYIELVTIVSKTGIGQNVWFLVCFFLQKKKNVIRKKKQNKNYLSVHSIECLTD